MIAFAKPHKIVALHPDEDNEWYTPSKYTEAARQVMETIDLDPASCELANQTVKASKFYTEQENGLSKAWHGNVWLNPPYGRVNGSGASKIRMFVTRLIDEYRIGHISQAILLSTVQPNATWFYQLWDYPICFFQGRIHFNRFENGMLAKNSRDSHTLGTIFVYFGANEQRFIDTFSKFGAVIPGNTAVRRQAVQPLSLWGDV